MKRTFFCLIMLVSVSLLFVSLSNAQTLKKSQLSKKEVFVKKSALLNSLKKLKISYRSFVKNPKDAKAHFAFNKALNDAVIKAKVLVKIAKEGDPEKDSPPPPKEPSPPPPPPPTPPQGPQGISKRDITKLSNMSNSLLRDFLKIRSINRIGLRMNTHSMAKINIRMKSIKSKLLQLALLEPRAEPKHYKLK